MDDWGARERAMPAVARLVADAIERHERRYHPDELMVRVLRDMREALDELAEARHLTPIEQRLAANLSAAIDDWEQST